MGYNFIREFDEKPNPSEVIDEFAVIRKKREPVLLAASNAIKWWYYGNAYAVDFFGSSNFRSIRCVRCRTFLR